MNQIIVFRLNSLYYGMDIMGISEIVNSLPITEIPNKTDYVEGIVNFRDYLYTIVNVHRLLKMERENEDNSQIVMLANGQIGLLVDEVVGIIDVTQDNKQTVEQLTIFEGIDYIKFIVEEKDKMITVVDFESMIVPEKNEKFLNDYLKNQDNQEVLKEEQIDS